MYGCIEASAGRESAGTQQVRCSRVLFNTSNEVDSILNRSEYVEGVNVRMFVLTVIPRSALNINAGGVRS